MVVASLVTCFEGLMRLRAHDYLAAVVVLMVGLALLGAELSYRKLESVMRPRGREIAARLLARSAQGNKRRTVRHDSDSTRADLS